MPKKIVYIVLDPSLPFDAVKTPNLDSVARRGRSGLVSSTGTGMFELLGYDPQFLEGCRGPVAALGAGIELESGDVAWRANFVTIDDAGVVVDDRVGGDLSDDEARSLADALNAEVSLAYGEARFVATRGSHGVLLLRGDVPPADLEREWLDAAHRVLETHEVNASRAKRGGMPANSVELRDAGAHLPLVTPLPERIGMRIACFVQGADEIGIGRMAGLEPIVFGSPADAEGYSDLADRALAELQDVDGVYVQIAEGDGDDAMALDEGFFGTLLRGVTRKRVLAVSAGRTLVVYAGDVSADGRKVFSEQEAALGALGSLRAPDVIPLLVELAHT
jgi:2,3-bisphosphoglycerate-independent phosphoglycerate mutase